MNLTIEFKRSFHNRFIMIFLFLHTMAVGLGYILLVALDKVEIVTATLLEESVYTVYTQFGLFLFSPFFINIITEDYKDKNIVFYKILGYNQLTYFLQKLLFISICSVLGSLLSSCLVFGLHGYYAMIPIFFAKILAVMLFFSTLCLFFSFVLGKFLVTFFTIIILWISGIFVSQISPPMNYFAYYDAVSYDYKDFFHFLRGKILLEEFMPNLWKNFIFDSATLVLFLFLLILLKRSWIKNGI